MCGFLAYIGDNLNSKRLESGLSSIYTEGQILLNFKKKEFTFGFNRLAIQDLSTNQCNQWSICMEINYL